jgi:hypothetical protein
MFFVGLFQLNGFDLFVGFVEFLFFLVDALVLVLFFFKFMHVHVEFGKFFLLFSQVLFHFLDHNKSTFR